MAKNKNRFAVQPIEKHTTAAWANVSGIKPVSNVSVPDESNVDEAKKWVEDNEK